MAKHGPMGRMAAAVGLALGLNGCFLADIDRQTAMLDSACVIEGSVNVQVEAGEKAELVVAVMQAAGEEAETLPIPVDYVIGDRQGSWRFALVPGNYSLLAFHDFNGNLVLDDNEPAHRVGDDEPIECSGGARMTDIEISIDPDDRVKADRVVSVGRDRGVVEAANQTAVSIGQLTSFGDVVELDDPRFDPEVASGSMWRPIDFIRDGHAGIYQREPFDPDRTPVLFIHGINGSPRVLTEPIESLDSDKFQAMYYYYPSGLRLGQIASHLYRVTREMEVRHGIERMHVVAHSMGGLVARAWLMAHAERGSTADIGMFVSISTPWLGHESARQGVDHSPVVVPVWRDMAAGSEFLEQLFTDSDQGAQAELHLLFSYRSDGWISREAGDGVATLASMLAPEVQMQADSVYGVDAGHVSILESPEALEHIGRILDRAESRRQKN